MMLKTKATGDIENTGSMCHEFDVENKSSVDVGNKRSVSNEGSKVLRKMIVIQISFQGREQNFLGRHI